MAEKPMPRINEISRPFWEACNAGALRLQRCTAEDCGRFIYYPRPCCPHCGCDELRWEDVSGQGTILSFTRIVRPQAESFVDDVPYYFVAVRLREGPTMFSRLARPPHKEEGLVGRAVRVVFVQHTVNQRLPYFALG